MDVEEFLKALGMEEGRAHRIDPETGEIESQGAIGWQPTGFRIDPRNGRVHERTAVGLTATGTRIDPNSGLVTTNHGERTGMRVDPQTGAIEEAGALPASSGLRVNRRTGVVEERGLLWWWWPSKHIAHPKRLEAKSPVRGETPPSNPGRAGGAAGDAISALVGPVVGLGIFYCVVVSPWFLVHCGAAWWEGGVTPDRCAQATRAALDSWYYGVLQDGRALVLSWGLLGIPMVIIGALVWLLTGFAFYVAAGGVLILMENLGPSASSGLLVTGIVIDTTLAFLFLRRLWYARTLRVTSARTEAPRRESEAGEVAVAVATLSTVALAIPGSDVLYYLGLCVAAALRGALPWTVVIDTAVRMATADSAKFYGAFGRAKGTEDAFGRMLIIIGRPIGSVIVNGVSLIAGLLVIVLVCAIFILAGAKRRDGRTSGASSLPPVIEALMGALLVPSAVVVGALVLELLFGNSA